MLKNPWYEHSYLKNYQLLVFLDGGGISLTGFPEGGPCATTQIPEGGAPEKRFPSSTFQDNLWNIPY